jgi:nickel/cobalt exporter
MTRELSLLTWTAVSIGVLHTLIGPDHYVPFIAMAQARKWTRMRLIVVTALCGVGHVGSSVLLGAIGIALGLAVGHLESVEATRGEIAAWVLTGFGLAYMIWGFRQAYRNHPHVHVHVHGAGGAHTHDHEHHGEHAHPHTHDHASLTPWILFTIFVLGPCEPLIPILMYPAATQSAGAVAFVAGAFSLATIATMLAAVLALHMGLARLPLAGLARYSHALAGFAILACALAIHFGL